MASLGVAFDAGLPFARWGPLFHVFRLERPEVVLEWHPVQGRSLPDQADVGLLVGPRDEPGVSGLVLDASPMVVVMAAGHPLADRGELSVADVLDQAFAADLDSEASAFWTLDEQRGAAPARLVDGVESADRQLAVVAAGRAIATKPVWVANCLAHPGVVALPLRDGPRVTTRLIWRADDANPVVTALVELARAWTSGGRGNGHHA
jgi:DNA-binding transcriptional LysR family regulator